MAKKKRKTRQEKIILQLKRELARQEPQSSSASIEPEPRQGSKSPKLKPKAKKIIQEKKSNDSIFSYDPRLIRKDLLKTLILTLIAFSLQFVLYLRLR